MGGLGTLALSTTGRVTVGSNVQTPILKIPGSNGNDNQIVQNSLGSTAARFQNDYNCLLNGDTTITGNITGSGELYAAGPATFNQTLAVSGNAMIGGNSATFGARSNVASNITNVQSDGVSSIYLNTPLGIGQIYSGENDSLNLTTHTAHPIRLNANRFAVGALNSIE